MAKNIVLTGFMGTGKSAIGKRLAKILKRKLYDTDKEVEEVTGLTIPKIFAQHGEIRFRSEEKLAVKKLAEKKDATQKGVIISTGGGVVLDEENIQTLSENGLLICLHASPEVILERVAKKGNRPLIKKEYGIAEIEEMLKERASCYQKADFFVDTSKEGFDYVINNIITFLKERGEI